MMLILEDGLNDGLTKQAAIERRTKMELVRFAIKQYIEDYRLTQKALQAGQQ